MAYPDGVTYLHDDSGASESFLGRVDRKGFSVRSATIIIQNLIWKASTKPMPPYDDDDTALRKWAFHNKPYDVVLNIIGVNDGEVVGQKQVKSRKSHLFDIKFGKTFGEVDMLFFQLSIPSFDHFFDFYEMLEPGQIWCGEFCGGAIVERISLDDPAPVPLPASLPLLGGALLFLGRRCIPAAGSAGVAALWRKAGSRAEFSSRA
ncbi:hypothetical protein [Alitabrizicola rongguiensis]|uniref:hypothetical protein n=1 Tax=Alitabrizicola rongguiensis TaxID=2909234 RepID=UPI001F443949|nr:hypothetical protein [Tabrizicola rongguiensis]